MREFDLIERHFRRPGEVPDVALGMGDDAALLRIPGDHELVVSVDTLVAGVHFPLDTPAACIGHKSLAVNLSDLAAMGARARWFTLAITLPAADDAWLHDFSRGLFGLAAVHDVHLVGGDTCRGPLSISIQAMGLVPAGRALRRDAARPGDDIWVTDTLGDAALALRMLQSRGRQPPSGASGDPGSDAVADPVQASRPLPAALRRRLDRPVPRLDAGVLLRDLAHACIDISDGLVQDLGHVLEASRVGACLDLERIPLSDDFHQTLAGQDMDWTLPLSGGDDYELLFTASPASRDALMVAQDRLGLPLTRIGRVEDSPGLRLRDAQGQAFRLPQGGFDHFRESSRQGGHS